MRHAGSAVLEPATYGRHAGSLEGSTTGCVVNCAVTLVAASGAPPFLSSMPATAARCRSRCCCRCRCHWRMSHCRQSRNCYTPTTSTLLSAAQRLAGLPPCGWRSPTHRSPRPCRRPAACGRSGPQVECAWRWQGAPRCARACPACGAAWPCGPAPPTPQAAPTTAQYSTLRSPRPCTM